MDEIDPQELKQLNESINQLTGNFKSFSANLGKILEDANKQKPKWKQRLERRLESEKEATEQNQKSTQAELTLEQKQQQAYKEELARRKVEEDAFGNLISSTVTLSATQKKALQIIDKRIEKEEKLERYARDPVKEFTNISSTTKSAGDILNKYQDSLYELTGKSKLLAGSFQLGLAGISGIIKATSTSLEAIYQGERGAKVGAKALKQLTEEVTQAAYGIAAAMLFLPGVGWLMKGAGVALAAITKVIEMTMSNLAEKGAEYNDRIYDAFNSLSESGLVTAEGMTGVSNTIKKLSVTAQQLEEFNKLVKGSSKDLALIGGTAAGGLEKFSEVAKDIVDPTKKLNEQLLALGYKSDEQREFTLKYLANESRTGFARGKTNEQLTKGSVAYMEELDRIAELTGITRKEQQDAREKALKIDELRAAMYNEQDEERRRELEAALTITERAFQEGRDEFGLAVARFYSARRGGAITREGTEAVAQMYDLRRAVEAIAKGQKELDSVELYGISMQDIERILDRTASVRKLGQTDLAGLGLLDKFSQNADEVQRMREAIKEAEGDPKKLSEILKRNQEERKKLRDQTLRENIRAQQVQQSAALIIDEAARMFDGAGLKMATAVKAFNEAVELLAGIKKQGAGTTPAPSSTQTARKRVEEAQQKLEDATKERERLEQEKGRGAEETKQARIKEFQAREEARRKALEEQSVNKGAGRSVAGGAAPAPEAPGTTPSTEQGVPEGRRGTTTDPRVKAMQESIAPAETKENDVLKLRMQLEEQRLTVFRERNTLQKEYNELTAKSKELREMGDASGAIELRKLMDIKQGSVKNLDSKILELGIELEKMPKALNGGVFTGPGSNTMGKAFDILTTIKNSVSSNVDKKSIESEIPGLEKMDNISSSTTKRNNTHEILAKLTDTMESKFNDLIDQVNINNGIKEEILDYSRI